MPDQSKSRPKMKINNNSDQHLAKSFCRLQLWQLTCASWTFLGTLPHSKPVWHSATCSSPLSPHASRMASRRPGTWSENFPHDSDCSFECPASCHSPGVWITGRTVHRRAGAKPRTPQVARAPNSGVVVSLALRGECRKPPFDRRIPTERHHSVKASDRISIGGALRLRTPPAQSRMRTPTLQGSTHDCQAKVLLLDQLGDYVAQPGTRCQRPALDCRQMTAIEGAALRPRSCLWSLASDHTFKKETIWIYSPL